MMTNSIFTVFYILLSCGIVGGLAHYFKNETRPDFRWSSLFKCILTGLVAAFTVPLFLHMVSSQLLENAQTDNTQYFVLIGFGLIAAYFSQRFLNTLSEQVFSELKSVKQKVADNEDKVDGLIDTQSDPGPAPQKKSRPQETSSSSDNDENVQQIIQAMQPIGNKPFRTVSGLSNDIGLDQSEITEMLSRMQKEDLVRSFRINNNSKEVYSLTPHGRQMLSHKEKKQSDKKDPMSTK